MDVNEIKQNALDGLETLKYILEIKIGEGLNELEYGDIDFSVSKNEGLFDIDGTIHIEMVYGDPDLSYIAGVFKKLNDTIDNVFGSHAFTNTGKLSKNKSGNIGIGYMLYDVKMNFGNETISIVLGINAYDY